MVGAFAVTCGIDSQQQSARAVERYTHGNRIGGIGESRTLKYALPAKVYAYGGGSSGVGRLDSDNRLEEVITLGDRISNPRRCVRSEFRMVVTEFRLRRA